MDKIAISIIVPVHNAEKYLPRCLDSLVNQTFKNIEIICVVDGSPDNSLEICKSYAQNDTRIVVISQKNQGVSSSRNTGLSLAKGEYIQWCDPDDIFTHDICDKLHGAISLSGADIGAAGIRVVYEQSDYISGDKEYYLVKSNGLTSVNEIVFRNTDVFLCNKIFRKSLIDEYNIKFPSELWYEDACFFYKYLFVSKTIFYVQDVFCYISCVKNVLKKQHAVDYMMIPKDIKYFLYENKIIYAYQIDIFLWIVIANMQLAVSCKKKDINDAVEIGSSLLLDIEDYIIKSCPCISKTEINELFAIKNNDAKMFFKIYISEIKKTALKKQLNAVASSFLPKGSFRRKVAGIAFRILRKIYRRLRGR